jgi:oligopeptidase B
MLRKTLWPLTLLLAATIFLCSCTSVPEPPVAKIEAKVDTMFGTEMVDNYFWLRDRENPEVIAYLEAENAYTDAVMAHTTDLEEALYQEIKGRIKETDLSVPVKRGDYYYYDRDEEGKQYAINCRKKGSLEAAEEIVLDENVLAEGHEFMSLGAYVVSPDHSMLVYGVDFKGNERYSLKVKNLTTGELFSDEIENTSGDVVWANDNKTLFYTVPNEAWRSYRLYQHTLGDDPADDKLIYQEDDEKFGVWVYKTKNDKYVMMAIGSKITDEVHFLDASRPNGSFKVIRPRETGVEYSVSQHGDKFYIRTNENATNFKVVTAPVSKPGKKNWKELIKHRDDVTLSGLDVFKDFMVVYARENGLQVIRVTDMNNNETYSVEFPEAVYSYDTHSNPDFNSNLLRYTYTSLVTPQSVFDYDMKTRTRELKKEREVVGGHNPDDYVSERVFATASDGVQVPISLVYKKGLVKDGSNPLYLYAYGSYGSSWDPYFSIGRLSILDRGFIYAIAHVRGGGEMGRKWKDDGKMLKKMNTFTDFIACAEHLVAEKYTNSDKMCAVGGSAGGLLVGAVVNMRPDLFNSIIGAVPFVDLMNTMLDASIPLTVVEYEEWGNPNEEEYFNYMMSYSPYDNIKAMDYPNILIMSSLNDTRVQYWEGAKWAAKLRANNTSQNRLLLKTNMGAGHGGSSGRYDALRELAFEYAFLLDCMNVTK